ncbi:MAG TPA: LuxR C-terminal-related transcriptional regulator [Steroidobacteraceae bacterium]
MADLQFQLKTAPPRVLRAAPVRKRLEHRWAEINDRAVIVITAPQGFGKTTLLAQWRRNWLERGAYVGWASLDSQDDRVRFVNLLLFALRVATGRESFAAAATQNLMQPNQELEALTTLLAEVALLATPTVVILDDAHRMPQDTMRELLAYLLNNAPPNLQFVIGSRRPLELQLTDLMATGRMAEIDARDLRFGLDESLEVLRARFGARIVLDDAVRLHEITEGWPLGLQLAASTVEKAVDMHEVVGQLSARRGDIHRFFFESLLSRMPPEEASFLVCIAILEVVNAEICQAVTGQQDAATYLERLARESPLVTLGEDRDWLRLHSMARDFLLGQFDKLPAEERRGYYERAAAWYADHGQLQDAARHALAAGNDALAVGFASKCLFDIAREGRLAEARDWIRRLPPHALQHDVHLQLSVAWITALGEDAATVPALIENVRQHPQYDDNCRFLAALVSAAAGAFCDQPGRVAEALEGWDHLPGWALPIHAAAWVNSRANLAYLRGDFEGARQLLAASLTGAPREPGMRLALGYGDMIFGLTHLFEGNPRKAIAVLRPRLELAEREGGRRTAVPSMLAGVLAGALMMCGETDQAYEVLADRLDVIERLAMPDSILMAYRALAEVTLRRGDEARALEILAALRELGLARNLPRLTLISLAEQVRIHASHGRTQTAAGLVAQIEALGPVFQSAPYSAMLYVYRRTLAHAQAYACLAAADLDGAETALRVAADVPPSARRGGPALVIRAMQTLVAHERGLPESKDMLAEVLSLADLAGIRSYVEWAHPKIARLLAGDPAAPSGKTQAVRQPVAGHSRSERAPAGPAAMPAAGGLLTPKEAHILALLAAGRANKEIARAMDIGEQTVKWHLKNVFFKLNAGSRKHAVDRARLLGLLEA